MPYYAVKKGKKTGIYTSWDEAKAQVTNFSNPIYKKFQTKQEAEDFMNQTKQTQITNFYKEDDPQESDKTLICFTDGSTLNNGKEDSKGGFATVWPFHPELDYAEKLTSCTNNRAEYSAIIHALKQADELNNDKTKTLIIYTDSMLIVNSMTKWLPNWKKNNYIKSDGKPVLNLDLIQILEQKMKERNVIFKHVMAHTNEQTWKAIYNDKADKLARNIALS